MARSAFAPNVPIVTTVRYRETNFTGRGPTFLGVARAECRLNETKTNESENEQRMSRAEVSEAFVRALHDLACLPGQAVTTHIRLETAGRPGSKNIRVIAHATIAHRARV